MERDKARIKPFCDQLAQLWENLRPRPAVRTDHLPAARRPPPSQARPVLCGGRGDAGGAEQGPQRGGKRYAPIRRKPSFRS